MGNKGYVEFLGGRGGRGANNVYYGGCGNGELLELFLVLSPG